MKPLGYLVLAAVFSTGCATRSAPANDAWLYLIDAGGNTSRLLRMRPDGSQVDTLARVAAASRGLAFDQRSRSLLWLSRDADRIQRAPLSDAGIGTIDDLPTTGLDSAYAVQIDARNAHMYWSDYGTGAIHRSDLDGRNVVTLVRGLVAPRGLDLDLTAGWLYWTDIGTKKVQRARLDGSGVQDLLTAAHGLDQPYGVTISRGNGRLYITDAGTGHILWSRLDGSDARVLIERSGPHPSFLIVVPEENRIYWGDNRANRVRRAQLDGSQIQDVIPGGLAGPRGLIYLR